jgi:hypothetical protein
MANGHGGARPGAGRKKQSTLQQQQARRDVLLEVFSPEAVREAAEALLVRMKTGDTQAWAQAAPYIFGSPRQETKHEVAVAGAVQIYLPERKLP